MEIEKKIDELTIEKWRFCYMYDIIFLDGYELLKKESPRHKKFNIIKQYERIMYKNNNITESEVPLSDELKAEVLNMFMSNIKVLKWSERE